MNGIQFALLLVLFANALADYPKDGYEKRARLHSSVLQHSQRNNQKNSNSINANKRPFNFPMFGLQLRQFGPGKDVAGALEADAIYPSPARRAPAGGNYRNDISGFDELYRLG